MKKRWSAAVAAVMFFALLAGCTGGYQDGTYKAETSDFSHGWKDYVVVEVAGGEVTVQEFDSLNEAGEKKSQNAEYREAMEPLMGTYPEKYLPEIVAEYEAKGSLNKMDNITGATNSTDSFKALVTAALENAKAGNSEVAVVTLEPEE